MGSYRNGRLVARSVMPPEAWAQIDEYGIFDEPVQVVLVARAAPPGVQCQLYAMVPLPEEEDDEPEEPWAASVPGLVVRGFAGGVGGGGGGGQRAAGRADSAGPHRPLRAGPGAPREPAAGGGGSAAEDHRREDVGGGGPGAGGSAGPVSGGGARARTPSRWCGTSRSVPAGRPASPASRTPPPPVAVAAALAPHSAARFSRPRSPPG